MGNTFYTKQRLGRFTQDGKTTNYFQWNFTCILFLISNFPIGQNYKYGSGKDSLQGLTSMSLLIVYFPKFCWTLSMWSQPMRSADSERSPLDSLTASFRRECAFRFRSKAKSAILFISCADQWWSWYTSRWRFKGKYSTNFSTLWFPLSLNDSTSRDWRQRNTWRVKK